MFGTKDMAFGVRPVFDKFVPEYASKPISATVCIYDENRAMRPQLQRIAQVHRYQDRRGYQPFLALI